jgi:uncharacterized protein YcnI
LLCFALGFAGTFVSAADAHIVLSETNFAEGTRFAAFFKVGHGCKGSPTTRLTVTIPADVSVITVPPKEGWTIDVATDDHAAPGHGRTTAITWRGHLAADAKDQFGLFLRLPDRTGPLYFPAVQTCETGESRWTDIPAAGQAWHDLPFPAPVINLEPRDAAMPDMDHGATDDDIMDDDMMER